MRQQYGRLRHGVHRWPLRARIIAVLAALLGAAMFVVGLAGSWQLQAYLIQREDADLRAAAPTLITSTIQQEAAKQNPRVPSVVPTSVYAVRLATTPASTHVVDYLPKDGPRPDFGELSVTTAHKHAGRPYTVTSVDDENATWRVVQGIDDDTGRPYAVATSLENVRGVVRRMQVLTVAVSSLALLIAVGTALFAVRRAMRPLLDIEDTAAAIAAGDLTRRVPNPHTADEVESLSDSLNVMLAQLEHSMAVKDRSEESMRRFVADASHELRTPLATVRGYAELYRQGAVTNPEDVAAGFRRIEDEATRMSRMVDDLLLLSRLETEQRAATVGDSSATRQESDVDLTVLAYDTVADARARTNPETGRRFEVRGRGGALEPVVVRGDEQRLRQVVINLLTNAERYTPADTVIEVQVGVEQDDDGRPLAVLAVVDHGPGIPHAERERVFERFFRADVARNRAAGSTGLGLSIVAAIVAAHQGDVEVSETPGGGATFVIRLPRVATTDAHDDDEIHSANEDAAPDAGH